jgi:V8-like Glu-specific endopeptidase
MGRAVLTLLLTIAFGCPAYAAIAGFDDRQYVATNPGSPYSPIGLVEGYGRYTTGTLINRCDVLTVEHLARWTSDPIGDRVTFYGALGSGHRRRSEGTIIATGDDVAQKERTPQSYPTVGSDWMIVRLDKCLGDKLGWARLVTQPPGDGTIPNDLQGAGFPTDRPLSPGLTVDPTCAIKMVEPTQLYHDCVTMPGNSGGPIFHLVNVDGAQRMEVFGMASVALGFDPSGPKRGQVNIATPTWNVTYDNSSPLRTGH